ncbi:UDP-glucose 4-epimerase GalE [Luteimonas sp. gir]|uniref:UDP-glucose 4-epimerase GalE n=1 Tax=Luteimonas sp. gir TaxID=3127960 RepID=UPI003075D29E
MTFCTEEGTTILVTGGAGYIGSHTSIALLTAGYDVVIVDNFCNSERWIPDRIRALAGRDLRCIELDLRNRDDTISIMQDIRPEGVIHFGALKSVGESIAEPLLYYRNNVCGTLNLLDAMHATDCKRLVFSSSATVYGHPDRSPVREDARVGAINPYGRTKLMMEQAIADVAAAGVGFHAATLRYFNPAGAHPSGRLGELPRGTPSNLVPYVAQVAAGLRPEVHVFGNDYATADGTGVRDYIHVMDLARAHVCALSYLERTATSMTVNLGTGCGYSVLEIIRSFSEVCGRDIPYRIVDRRPGDTDSCFADPTLAETLLRWRAEHGLAQICADAWRWEQHLHEA